MSDVREILLEVAEAGCDGLEGSVPGPIRLKRRTVWDDHLVEGRKLPLHAAELEFAEPLADVMVIVTSLPEEQATEVIQHLVRGILDRLGLDEDSYDVPQPVFHEFDSASWAADNLDALFDEPTARIESGHGEITAVFGTPFLEAADRIMRKAAGLPVSGGDDAMLDEFGMPIDGGELGDDEVAALAGAGDPAAEAPEGMSFGPGSEQGDEAQAVDLPDLTAEQSLSMTPEEARAEPGQFKREWSGNLTDVNVRVTAELGHADIRLGDVAGLADDSVVQLEQEVGDPVGVYVNGSLYATARLVVVDGEYGIEILEVVNAREPSFHAAS